MRGRRFCVHAIVALDTVWTFSWLHVSVQRYVRGPLPLSNLPCLFILRRVLFSYKKKGEKEAMPIDR
jgi:hypothetical protein